MRSIHGDIMKVDFSSIVKTMLAEDGDENTRWVDGSGI